MAMTEDQKKALSERMKKFHADKKAQKADSPEPMKVAPQNVPRLTEPEAVDEEVDLMAEPVNLFSGDSQRLQIYDKNGNLGLAGYVTRWFTDEKGTGVRINMARRSGWEFITRDEVSMNDSLVPLNSDLGNYVTQVVNPHADGQPEIGYAMKISVERFERYQQEREEKVNGKIDRALRTGMVSNNPNDRQFAAGSDIAIKTHSGLPPIEIGTRIVRRL